MNKTRLFSLLCAVLFASMCGSHFAVAAEEIEAKDNSFSESDIITSVGLIQSYSLSISAGSKKIYISSMTRATALMAKVGFKNIYIQRSTNGVSGWTNEKTLSDDLADYNIIHTKNAEQRSVNGGYYYRVVMDHYAKEAGYLHPGTESITNYSNVVWVPAS